MAKIEERPGKVSFLQAWKDFFIGYVDFKGRSTRAGYWWVKIFTQVLAIVALVAILFPIIKVLLLSGDRPSEQELMKAVSKMIVPIILLLLVAIAIVVPNITLTVRRMRDVGLRGRGQATLLVLFLAFSYFTRPDLNQIAAGNIEESENYLSMLWSLGLFILSLLPTGTLTTSKETGILAFFFKNKRFYEDSSL